MSSEIQPHETCIEIKDELPLLPPRPVIADKGDIERGSIDQLQCRICLETDGRDFISPCRCKGSSKYVHRECLDKWRIIREGFAFSNCTTCKMRYHLRVQVPKDRKWRITKFRFFVVRDVLFVGFCIQSVFCSLFFLWTITTMSFKLFKFTAKLIVSLGYLAYYFDKKAGDILFHSWKVESVLPFYYFCGMVLFFMLSGLFGCFCTCYDRRFRNNLAQPCHDCFILCCAPFGRDCHHPGAMCLWMDCSVCAEGFSASSAECISAAAGTGGEMGAVIIVTAGVIALFVFAIVGVFYSLVVATIVGQRIWQRHYHILAKRMLTKEYLVEDLNDEQLAPDYQLPPLPPEHLKQLQDLGLL